MINLEAGSRLAKWFVWSCDHLPFTAGSDGHGTYRTGAYYVEHGTTLCHIFWATLWVPILVSAFAGFLLSVFGMMHVEMYGKFSPTIGPVAALLPEAIMLGAAAAVALFILAIVGGAKSGFFKLLGQYLKGIKSRICPLVRFDGAQPAISD